MTYSMQELETMSEKEVRKLYTKQRDIMRKRAKRLDEAGFGDHPNVQRYKSGEFPTIKEIDAQGLDIRRELNQLGKANSRQDATVKNARKQAERGAEELKKYGYQFVQPKNYYRFLGFLKSVKSVVSDILYDSDAAARVFKQVDRLKLPEHEVMRHFNEYQANIEKLEQFAPVVNGRRQSVTLKNLRRRKFYTDSGEPEQWTRTRKK